MIGVGISASRKNVARYAKDWRTKRRKYGFAYVVVADVPVAANQVVIEKAKPSASRGDPLRSRFQLVAIGDDSLRHAAVDRLRHESSVGERCPSPRTDD